MKDFSTEQIEAKIWAYQNQSLLRYVTNLEETKELLQIPAKYKNFRIFKITPNSLHFLLGQDEKLIYATSINWINYQVYEKLAPIVEKMQIAFKEERFAQRMIEDKYKGFLHFSDLKHSNFLPQIFLNNTQFTVGTGDGFVTNDPGTNISWAAMRSGNGTSAGTSGTTVEGPTATQYTGPAYTINRSFWPTDTSGLTSSATVSAANMNIYFNNAITANQDTTSLDLVKTSQASNTALATTDFSSFTNTSIGNRTYALIITNTNSYNVIAISDLTAISQTGFSKIGGISHLDLANSAPANGHNNDLDWNASDNASNKPYIDVTYTLPSTGSGSGFLLHFT